MILMLNLMNTIPLSGEKEINKEGKKVWTLLSAKPKQSAKRVVYYLIF